MTTSLFMIHFYVPEEHCDSVKLAMFNAGTGKTSAEAYDHCAWQTLGRGQFRPTAGSKPFIGSLGEDEFVAEYKVEMICEATNIKAVIAALKETHPYEVPAYYVMQMVDM